MKLIILVIVSTLLTCSSCIDLPKCSLYDEKCQLDFFQSIGRDLAFTGIPDLGIPVIDPFKVTNVEMPILGLWNLTLIEGDATGIQQCLVTRYISNVPERYKEPEMTCNKIVIMGKYKLTASPLVKLAFPDIHGEGFIKITLENWYYKFRYPFKIVREANKKIYLKAIFDKAVYETRVDNTVLETCGVKAGIIDISGPAAKIFNENWKLVMASEIGKLFYDKSAQYYYDIYGIFFDNVPADEYLSDDLSGLVDETIN